MTHYGGQFNLSTFALTLPNQLKAENRKRGNTEIGCRRLDVSLEGRNMSSTLCVMVLYRLTTAKAFSTD